MSGSSSVEDRLAEVYESDSRKILATLVRLLGDVDRAEEALHDAFHAALRSWPRTGIPRNPTAWLVSAGKFRGIDAIRRQGRGAELAVKATEAASTGSIREDFDGSGAAIADDLLRLIFTCCHPAIPIDSRVALTLRTVCGLTTEETARAFHVPTETMKRRISRAKAKIRREEIPYEVPSPTDLPHRLESVLRVVYLIYNEGYSATAGALHLRRDLATEAVYLARLVVDLLPRPESTALLALLLFHESRSAARVDPDGDPIALEHQDRSRWDRDQIAEATVWLRRSTGSEIGAYAAPYLLQAAIAATHVEATSIEATDWDRIIGYYEELLTLQRSPIVSLQRAIAIGMRDGADVALPLVEELLEDERLSHDHHAHHAHAELARRAGRLDAARSSYRRAASLARQSPERRYIEKRQAEIADPA